jgi:hypothetical protein
MLRTSGGLLVSALLALTVACGSDPAPSPGCIAGQTVACACPSGAVGAQTCLADHSSGTCACSGSDAGAVDAPTSDAPVLDAPVLDAPVLDAPVLDAPVLDVPAVDLAADVPSTELPSANADTGCPPASVDPGGTVSCDGACRDTRTDVAHCGRCGNACAIGTPCVAGVCEARPPRPIAPLSTSTVTSQQPTLRWVIGPNTDGTRVELCRDRAMTRSCLAPIDATAASARPEAPLAPGVWFWRLTGSRAGVATAPTATWQFTVGARSAPRDGSWGATLDLNGDGFADLAVGSSERIYVYPGGATGLSTTGTSVPMPSGGTIVSAGDVNGDGFGDLLAGSGSYRTLGVFLGGPAGLTTTPILRMPGSMPLPASELAALGDINGDGYSDVALGHYLFMGSASGPGPTATTLNDPAGDPYGGASLLGIDDVDGDGFSDVVTRSATFGGNAAMYLYRGSATGLGARTPVPVPVGATRLGSAFASAGDVNGDGFNDVLVGDNGSSRAYLYLVGPSGLSASAIPLTGYGTMFYAGGLSGAGDLNGDGYSDVVMGSGSGNSATVYFGSATGVSSTPTALMAPAGGYSFGSVTVGLGDVDGDGFGELAVGASNSSRVFVFRGGASGVPATTTMTFMGPTSVSYGGSIARARGRTPTVFDAPAQPGRRAVSCTRSPSPA